MNQAEFDALAALITNILEQKKKQISRGPFAIYPSRDLTERDVDEMTLTSGESALVQERGSDQFNTIRKAYIDLLDLVAEKDGLIYTEISVNPMH